MISQDERSRLPGKALTIVRIAWFVCALAVAIVLLGALPGYYPHYAQSLRSDPYGLGQFNLPFQLLVGLSDLASGFVSFFLAALLFWRKPNDRMALFASFFLLLTAPPSGISLGYFLTTYFGSPPVYSLASALSTPLWILIACIFPDGHFVPRWMRWVFLVSIVATFSIFVGLKLSFVDVVTYPLFLLVMAAQVYRYRRVSNYVERKQTKWVVFGFVVSMGFSLIASLIYKQLSPPLINVFPLAFTIAILRSHLWDIDIIIRKTLVYTVLTALLALIYFSSVVLLQRLVGVLTGVAEGSPLTVVVSTLAIAALFTPLRRRIQDIIDRRFFRKKYDAQRVLAAFAVTARDETDLDALTAELAGVVQETMQPERVSVWLRSSGQGKLEAQDAKP
jgi:hypothetical protein